MGVDLRSLVESKLDTFKVPFTVSVLAADVVPIVVSLRRLISAEEDI